MRSSRSLELVTISTFGMLKDTCMDEERDLGVRKETTTSIECKASIYVTTE
jgi:hypothetical protein